MKDVIEFLHLSMSPFDLDSMTLDIVALFNFPIIGLDHSVNPYPSFITSLTRRHLDISCLFLSPSPFGEHRVLVLAYASAKMLFKDSSFRPFDEHQSWLKNKAMLSTDLWGP